MQKSQQQQQQQLQQHNRNLERIAKGTEKAHHKVQHQQEQLKRS